MIHWAGLEGRQTAMVSSLFKAYFTEGRDIGDRDVLLEIAASVGLDLEMITRLLDGDADYSDIAERDAHARARGVTGVPTHIIASQHVLPGAQQPDLWARVIEDIAAQLTEAKE